MMFRTSSIWSCWIFIIFNLVISNSTPINNTLPLQIGAVNTSVLKIDSKKLNSHVNFTNPNLLTTQVVRPDLEHKQQQKFENASTIFLFPQQSYETLEDRKTQEEWGGNCTLAYWDKCKVIKTWFATHVDESDPALVDIEVDCKLEPVLCMYNGWTVNRCHLLCMGECNKEMMYKFEKYVNHEGECKAHAHG